MAEWFVMRVHLGRLLCVVLSLSFAGCIEAPGPSPAPANLIIVSEFTVPQAVVTLDPSFGFSLNRGSPGVPTAQRAASLGRAVGFLVADSITGRLRRLGYDAISAETASVEVGGPALLVTGTFLRIDEGHRREIGTDSGVAVEGGIQFVEPGIAARQLTTFRLDSGQLSQGVAVSPAASRETGVNLQAARVGSDIGRIVAELVQRENLIQIKR